MNLDFLLTQFYVRCAYLGTDMYDDAVEILEKAMARYDMNRLAFPARSVIMHYFLGEANEAAERPKDTIEQYEIFLDIWKNADEEIKILDTARTRLARLKGES